MVIDPEHDDEVVARCRRCGVELTEKDLEAGGRRPRGAKPKAGLPLGVCAQCASDVRESVAERRTER